MSYANADRRTYSFPAVNFATNSAQAIRGPKGKMALLQSISMSATTTFTATTTQGRVDVGVTGTPQAYASLPLGTTAAGGAIASDDSARTAPVITQNRLPADTDVLMSFVAPTGGSPAGVGTVTVVIDWML